MGEEERKCGLCRKDMGTLEHLLFVCEYTREWTMNIDRDKLCNLEYVMSERGNIEIVKLFGKIDRKLEELRTLM